MLEDMLSDTGVHSSFLDPEARKFLQHWESAGLTLSLPLGSLALCPRAAVGLPSGRPCAQRGALMLSSVRRVDPDRSSAAVRCC